MLKLIFVNKEENEDFCLDYGNKRFSGQQNWCMCISIVIPYLQNCWNTLNIPKLGIQTDPSSSPCVLWWEKSVRKHCWLPAIKPCSVLGPLKNFLFGGTSCPSGCPGQPSLCPLGREEWAGNVGQCLPNTEGRAWGKSSNTQTRSENPVWRGNGFPRETESVLGGAELFSVAECRRWMGQCWSSWEAAGIWGEFCKEKQHSGSAGSPQCCSAATVALKIELKGVLFETSKAWAAF